MLSVMTQPVTGDGLIDLTNLSLAQLFDPQQAKGDALSESIRRILGDLASDKEVESAVCAFNSSL